MYRRPHVICVAALVCQSGPALAIREPGSACGIRVGQNQFPPLEALWNGESGWRRNALNPASGAYGINKVLTTERAWRSQLGLNELGLDKDAEGARPGVGGGHARPVLVLPEGNASGDRNRRELNHHKRDCAG
jgi:hypothetical protein